MHPQGRVALLQLVPIRLKALKPKETDFEPQTLGQHLRKRRLELELSQRQLATRLRVSPWTVLNWEKGRTEPPFEAVPGILRWLGYDPCPAPQTIAERLLAKRRAMGWSIRQAARQFGVDLGTWGDWEHDKVILFRDHRALVARLLGLPIDEVNRDMEERWIRSHK